MKRRKRKDWIPGLIITLVVLVAALIFMGLLAMTRMIPDFYMMVIGIVLALLVLIIALLVHRTRHAGRFTAGILMAFVMLAVTILGSLYVNKTRTALGKISGVNTEVTQVSVYVRADDPADSVEATTGYTYGILSSLDRENTDGAVEHLKSQFVTDVQTMEYAGLTEIADGLLNGETGAILLNQAYEQVLAEMDGYTDIESRIKEVGTVEVEKVIESNNNDKATPTVTENGGKIYTVYISGIDTRGEMAAKSRSDVNIIATVNTDTHQVLLVSTPRDYFVPLSISNGEPDKLTHAGIYGIDVCMDTLGML